MEKDELAKKEKDIIAHIYNLKWTKKIGINNILYTTTYYDGKKIEFKVKTISKNKDTTSSFILTYNEKKFQFIKYDGNAILQSIERTHPSLKKKNIIHTVHRDRILSEDEKIIRKMKREKAKEERKVKKENEKKLRQQLKEKEEEKIISEHVIKKDELKTYENKKEPFKDLPQISVKDLLVRRTIFKCMHSNHNVKDLTAVVKVIDDDGVPHLEKITAGYCEQCKIYFIMEMKQEF